ncbi:YhcG family protein [Capnocytophaga genosp. AHN8471]|uniref:PDDEXK nuclease domain-containing protein n=1 Tax=Capnocytophaga genosp. AHN8471 TaxID=327574 RepID=UPI001932B364|nr:PDDEXK nuclease domain-containing protein [Capnocytophaga genosp. AHN8471]MBM0657935.1 DUF1016 family protein [Capnocytophaga genosp. AHN8471]
MKEETIQPTAIECIKTAILQSQYIAAKEVNRVQLSLYFAIGRYISENTRTHFWGTGALAYISEQLQHELPGLRGFSETNLRSMRTFYEEWKNTLFCISVDYKSADASADLDTAKSSVATDDLAVTNTSIKIEELEQLLSSIRYSQVPNYKEWFVEAFLNIGFSHHKLILTTVKDLEERIFYIELSIKEQLSFRALQKAIKADEFHHRGVLPNNFIQTLPSAQQALKAVSMFKDSYLLDFINVEELGVRDVEDIDERVVEQQIVQNVKQFIMAFGYDFAFLGNQFRVEALGHTHIIDLLFYHRELACLVAIELKTGDFKTAYLGQMNGYLTVLDDFVRKPNENPSIGIILCRKADQPYVQYIVRNYDKPMGVATFKTADEMPEKLRKTLPPIEELKKLL